MRRWDRAVSFSLRDASRATAHSGVESKCGVSPRQVVVHRLRNAHDLDAESRELCGYTQRVVPADGDDGIQVHDRNIGDGLLDKSRVLERVGSGGAEDRAATVDDLVDAQQVKGFSLAGQQSLPAFDDADTLIPVVECPEHRATYGRVESRAIPAACQDSDSHL